MKLFHKKSLQHRPKKHLSFSYVYRHLKSFHFSSPLRYLVAPAAKNLLPLFDGLSWKTLEKRPKFPHVTEGDESLIRV